MVLRGPRRGTSRSRAPRTRGTSNSFYFDFRRSRRGGAIPWPYIGQFLYYSRACIGILVVVTISMPYYCYVLLSWGKKHRQNEQSSLLFPIFEKLQ